METQPSSVWSRTTTRRVLIWLFRWRVMRWFVFSLAGLFTFVALVYAIENWRGRRAWERYRSELQARGEQLDLAAFIPPPVPDEQNLAMTPFLAPLFDFVKERKPGESPWRDTNAFARAAQFAGDLAPRNHPSQSGWREGKTTDWAELAEWLSTCRAEGSRAVGPVTASTIGDHSDAKAVAQRVLDVLRPYDPVFDELRAASKRPFSRFNISYNEEENPYAILLPHLSVTKRVCQLLQIRALAHLALNQRDRAFDDVRLMLDVTDSIKDEPILISFLVRLADFHIAMQVIWEGLAERRWSDAQLQYLQKRLSDYEFLRDLRHTLRGERAFGIKLAERLRRAPQKAMLVDSLGFEGGDQDQTKLAGILLNLVPRGWFYFEQLNYTRLFQETILSDSQAETARLSPGRIRENSNRLETLLHAPGSRIWNHMMLASTLLPAISNVSPKASYAHTAADQAAVACALERYRLANNAYPDRLEMLAPQFIETIPADVITGKPLVYRPTENERYQLHSVGWDEVDSGGSRPALQQPQSAKSSKSKPPFNIEIGDWVWRYPNKSEGVSGTSRPAFKSVF